MPVAQPSVVLQRQAGYPAHLLNYPAVPYISASRLPVGRHIHNKFGALKLLSLQLGRRFHSVRAHADGHKRVKIALGRRVNHRDADLYAVWRSFCFVKIGLAEIFFYVRYHGVLLLLAVKLCIFYLHIVKRFVKIFRFVVIFKPLRHALVFRAEDAIHKFHSLYIPALRVQHAREDIHPVRVVLTAVVMPHQQRFGCGEKSLSLLIAHAVKDHRQQAGKLVIFATVARADERVGGFLVLFFRNESVYFLYQLFLFFAVHHRSASLSCKK